MAITTGQFRGSQMLKWVPSQTACKGLNKTLGRMFPRNAVTFFVFDSNSPPNILLQKSSPCLPSLVSLRVVTKIPSRDDTAFGVLSLNQLFEAVFSDPGAFYGFS